MLDGQISNKFHVGQTVHLVPGSGFAAMHESFTYTITKVPTGANGVNYVATPVDGGRGVRAPERCFEDGPVELSTPVPWEPDFAPGTLVELTGRRTSRHPHLPGRPAMTDAIPCAYCGKPTPPDQQAAPAWNWPGKGLVTNCLTCAGFEKCPRCKDMFDNSEMNADTCGPCQDDAALHDALQDLHLKVGAVLQDVSQFIDDDELESDPHSLPWRTSSALADIRAGLAVHLRHVGTERVGDGMSINEVTVTITGSTFTLTCPHEGCEGTGFWLSGHKANLSPLVDFRVDEDGNLEASLLDDDEGDGEYERDGYLCQKCLREVTLPDTIDPEWVWNDDVC